MQQKLIIFKYDIDEQKTLWKKLISNQPVEEVDLIQLIKLIRGWDDFIRMNENVAGHLRDFDQKALVEFFTNGQEIGMSLDLEKRIKRPYQITTEQVLEKILTLRPELDNSLTFITEEIQFFDHAYRIIIPRLTLAKVNENVIDKINSLIDKAIKDIADNFSLPDRKKILQECDLAIRAELSKLEENNSFYSSLETVLNKKEKDIKNLLNKDRESKAFKEGEKLKEKRLKDIKVLIKDTKEQCLKYWLGEGTGEKPTALITKLITELQRIDKVFYEKIAEGDPDLANLMTIQAEMKKMSTEISEKDPNHASLEVINSACSEIEIARTAYIAEFVKCNRNKDKLNNITKKCRSRVRDILNHQLGASDIFDLANLMSIKTKMEKMSTEISKITPNHPSLTSINEVCSKINNAKNTYISELTGNDPTEKLNNITSDCLKDVKTIVRDQLVESKVLDYSKLENFFRSILRFIESIGKLPIRVHQHAGPPPHSLGQSNTSFFNEKSPHQQTIEEISTSINTIPGTSS